MAARCGWSLGGCNPFRVGLVRHPVSQGSSKTRNPGLNDAIPLGLKLTRRNKTWLGNPAVAPGEAAYGCYDESTGRARLGVRRIVQGGADMKCDICGKETEGDPIFDTYSEGLSGESFPNKTLPLTMCATCFEARSATRRVMAWSILLIVGGLLAAALLVWLCAHYWFSSPAKPSRPHFRHYPVPQPVSRPTHS